MKKFTWMLAIIFAGVFSASVSNAAWVRLANRNGAVDGLPSPLTGIVWEFTTTDADTIDALALPSVGGYVQGIRIDLSAGATAPDSVTTSMVTSESIPYTDVTSIVLTADGWVLEPTGNPIGTSLGLIFNFTGTIAIGDTFKIIIDVLN